MFDTEQDAMSSEELSVAYAEAQLAGQIEYKGEGEDEVVGLSETGLRDAWKLWFKTPPKERLLLFFLVIYMHDAGETLEEDEE